MTLPKAQTLCYRVWREAREVEGSKCTICFDLVWKSNKSYECRDKFIIFLDSLFKVIWWIRIQLPACCQSLAIYSMYNISAHTLLFCLRNCQPVQQTEAWVPLWTWSRLTFHYYSHDKVRKVKLTRHAQRIDSNKRANKKEKKTTTMTRNSTCDVDVPQSIGDHESTPRLQTNKKCEISICIYFWSAG